MAQTPLQRLKKDEESAAFMVAFERSMRDRSSSWCASLGPFARLDSTRLRPG